MKTINEIKDLFEAGKIDEIIQDLGSLLKDSKVELEKDKIFFNKEYLDKISTLPIRCRDEFLRDRKLIVKKYIDILIDRNILDLDISEDLRHFLIINNKKIEAIRFNKDLILTIELSDGDKYNFAPIHYGYNPSILFEVIYK